MRFALLVIVACGSSAPPPAQQPAPAASDPSCPVEVPGTSVTVEDVDHGAALVFVTTGDVAAVRTRSKALADAISKHDSASMLASMLSTPSTAAEVDADHGARVVVTAQKPDDAPALQSELRMHAQHLASGSCKMAM